MFMLPIPNYVYYIVHLKANKDAFFIHLAQKPLEILKSRMGNDLYRAPIIGGLTNSNKKGFKKKL